MKEIRLMVLMTVVALVIAAVAVVIAEASNSDVHDRQADLFTVARAGVAQVNDSIEEYKQAERDAAYAQQVAQLQAQKEKERRDAEAASRFGNWGPDLVEAAGLYGQDAAALYRVMSCESGGNPQADNGVNKGLFQFHPGTFAGTPYGGASIYDGRSQIFAAAWMWSQGRKGEWGCV